MYFYNIMVYNTLVGALTNILKKEGLRMKKFDDFDLDVKVNKGASVHPDLWTSAVACTPGTCYDGCSGDTTYNSNCCPVLSAIFCSAAC